MSAARPGLLEARSLTSSKSLPEFKFKVWPFGAARVEILFT